MLLTRCLSLVLSEKQKTGNFTLLKTLCFIKKRMRNIRISLLMHLIKLLLPFFAGNIRFVPGSQVGKWGLGVAIGGGVEAERLPHNYLHQVTQNSYQNNPRTSTTFKSSTLPL